MFILPNVRSFESRSVRSARLLPLPCFHFSPPKSIIIVFDTLTIAPLSNDAVCGDRLKDGR